MAIDGNRTLAVQPDGTKVYTPFPEYEKTVPATGSSTERNHYTLAGQLIAVRVKVAGQTGAFYYFYTDRQGSVHALRKADGTWVNGNYARYDAYGGYRTKPATTVNPSISDRGYTGHRMNNTGNDLGLIYMNARYYLPEVGRFISADTIVPEPSNPQSFNRYSYGYNNPVKYVDPSGHDPLGQQWQDEFEQFHNRQSDWFDEFIRLFSIAYPDEWNWSNFYNPDGTFKGFGAILVNPPASRSWDSLPSALARLGTAYTADEKDLFVRDVGFLYGAMPARSQNPGWKGYRPYYSVGAFPGNPPFHLQSGSLPEGFFVRPNGQSDADFNMHHWAWAFTLGYELSFYGTRLNHGRELLAAIAHREPVDSSDLAIGSLGIYTGAAFHSASFEYSDFPQWFDAALQVDAAWYVWILP